MQVYFQLPPQASGPPPTQPETNTHFLGRFTNTSYKTLSLLRYASDGDHSSTVIVQPSTEPHYSGRFAPTRYSALSLLRQAPALDVPAALAQPETNTHFIGRYRPTQHQLLQLLRSSPALDIPVPPQPETNTHYIGRFTPTQHRLLQSLLRNTPTDFTLPPQPETNINFLGRYRGTEHRLFRKLWQNSDGDHSGPVVAQPSTPPHFIGRYRPIPYRTLQLLRSQQDWVTPGPILPGPSPITRPSYRPAPVNGTDPLLWNRSIAEVVNNMLSGKMNVTLDVTLNPSALTTTIQDPRIGPYTAIIPAHGLTADGAAAVAAGIWPSNAVSAVGSTPGSATLNHASNPATDQTIRFVLLG